MEWKEFTQRLARELMHLPANAFLVVQAPGGFPYAQAMRYPTGLSAEVVSNEFLPPPLRLDPLQEQLLQDLDWQTPGEHGHVNWWQQLALPPDTEELSPEQSMACGRLGASMAAALHRVFGVQVPAHLEYRANRNGPDGGPLALPFLGIPPVEAVDPTPAPADNGPVRPASPASPWADDPPPPTTSAPADWEPYTSTTPSTGRHATPGGGTPASSFARQTDHAPPGGPATAGWSTPSDFASESAPTAPDEPTFGLPTTPADPTAEHQPTATGWGTPSGFGSEGGSVAPGGAVGGHPFGAAATGGFTADGGWRAATGGFGAEGGPEVVIGAAPTGGPGSAPGRMGTEPMRRRSRLCYAPTHARGALVTEQPPITDPDEVARLVRYLRRGTGVLHGGTALDEVEPERGEVVPVVYLTDGVWVWSAAQRYYLERYGIPPHPAFYEHIVALGYQVPDVTDELLLEAGEVATGALAPAPLPTASEPFPWLAGGRADERATPHEMPAPETLIPETPVLDAPLSPPTDQLVYSPRLGAGAEAETGASSWFTPETEPEPEPEPPVVQLPPEPVHDPMADPEFERWLEEARARGDHQRYFGLILDNDLFLPSSGDPAELQYATADFNDGTYVLAYTSTATMQEALGGQVAHHRQIPVRELIATWPKPEWRLAINAGLATAAFVDPAAIEGLAAPPAGPEPARRPEPAAVAEIGQMVMQKVVPPEHVIHYLKHSYDRVCGYVYRHADVRPLKTPAQLIDALGLSYEGSPFAPDDETIHVLRWTSVKPALCRRPTLRYADEAIPEFRVDSQRLPHGAELYRLEVTGRQTLIAVFDADRRGWKRWSDA